MRVCGMPASESAVEAALAWLARHQQADGSWTVPGEDGRARADAACTGLAVLAFLGAGYTQRGGKYSDNLKRALAWLAANQDQQGRIGTRAGAADAGHPICGLALSEAMNLGSDQALRDGVQKALDFSLRTWAAGDGPAAAPDPEVTGWLAMQVRSGQINGLKADDAALGRVRRRVEALGAGRAGAAGVEERPPVLQAAAAAAFGRRIMGEPIGAPGLQQVAERLADAPPAWVEPVPGRRREADGAGPLSEQERKDLARLIRELGDDSWDVREGATRALAVRGNRVRPLVGAALASADPEVGDRAQRVLSMLPPEGLGPGSLYQYWHFGTMATFLQGGEPWRRWNPALRGMLQESRHEGGPLDGSDQDLDGSWEPLDAADSAGRVWTTALAALTLEIYYRYLPVLNGK